MTVIAWEYERQRKKDLDKKAKEDAFRQALDQKYIDEKTVLFFLHYLLLSAAANRHTRLGTQCVITTNVPEPAVSKCCAQCVGCHYDVPSIKSSYGSIAVHLV